MHFFFSNKKLRDAQVKVRYHFLLIAEPGNLCALILFEFTTTSKRFSVFQNTLQINNIILGNTYLDSLQNSPLQIYNWSRAPAEIWGRHSAVSSGHALVIQISHIRACEALSKCYLLCPFLHDILDISQLTIYRLVSVHSTITKVENLVIVDAFRGDETSLSYYKTLPHLCS